MLVNFSVGNFLSFKGVQTLSLVPESLKEHLANLHVAYFYNPNEKLLKSVALHGHNAYGKTNFLKAFKFFQSFIFNSFTNGQSKTSIDVEPFRLNTIMNDKPCYFEVTFLVKETKYRYKILVNSKQVISEELWYAQAKIRENLLFDRKLQLIKVSKQWNKEAENKVEQFVPFAKPHILFLSVLLSQDDISRITSIGQWIYSNLIIPDDYLSEFAKARLIYSDPQYRSIILKFIERADLGFTTIFDKIETKSKSHSKLEKGLLNIIFEKEIKEFELYTGHPVFDGNYNIVGNVEFNLQKNESAGSIKYFIVVCFLSLAIKNSQLIWIDELDARLHSDLLEMLIGSFHDPDINPINSQLIFTTHNTILLDNRLRRDQMVIVEKNQSGESILKRAHSAENPVKIGKSLEREYRKGKLGGVSKKIRKDLGPTLFDD